MKLLYVLLFSTVFISCREEIISPENSTGNINQPVIERHLNSFSFVVNAGDITYNVYEYLQFDYNRAQVFISVPDYSSGFVNISLYSKSKRILYTKKADTEIEGEVYKVEGQIPETLHLYFQNFTGILKVTVTRSQ